MTIFVRDETVVLRTDAEFADISNPRGEVYGTAFYIVNEAPDGSRQRHSANFWHEEPAEVFASCVSRSLGEGCEIHPDCWFDIDPRYGSKAYRRLDSSGYFYAREQKENDHA